MAEKHILKYPKKGATLIYYQQNVDKVTDITVGFNCGSKCDGVQKGKAHALEHCLMHGTNDLKKEQLYELFRNTATETNAATSQDYVNVTMNTPNSQFKKIAKIMSEMITKNVIDENEWKREREVILQESYMFSKDNEGETEPYSFLIDNNKSLLKDDDLLGTKETLNSITTQDLLDYKDKYFVTDNMVVSVVSSLPFEYVKKVVEEEFINKIPSKPQNKVDFKKVRYRFTSKKLILDKPKQESFNITFMFKRLQNNEKNDLYSVFEDWYFNDWTGKMYKKLRLENPLVYYAGFSNLELVDLKLKYFHISTSPENVNKCIDCMTQIFRDAIVNGISEEEFKKFKEWVGIDRERKTNIKTHDSDDLYRDYIRGEKVFVKHFYEKLNKLTREDINLYLKKIYARSKVAVHLEGDISKAEKRFKLSENPYNAMTDEAIEKAFDAEEPIYSIEEIVAKYNPIEEFKQKCYEPTLVNVTDSQYYDMPESFKDQIEEIMIEKEILKNLNEEIEK